MYDARFPEADRARKAEIWRVLAERWFQKWVRDSDTVLDVGCGFGELVNAIRAKRRIAVDTNEAVRASIDPAVEFHPGPVGDLSWLPDGSIDVAFASNVLEHLADKAAVDRLLVDLHEKLVPGGRLVVMGPNVRLVPGAYWDFWDHHVPLSDRSLREALVAAGYRIDVALPRFLPYTTQSALPQRPWLVAAYLAMPAAWRVFGRQFFFVARRAGG